MSIPVYECSGARADVGGVLAKGVFGRRVEVWVRRRSLEETTRWKKYTRWWTKELVLLCLGVLRFSTRVSLFRCRGVLFVLQEGPAERGWHKEHRQTAAVRGGRSGWLQHQHQRVPPWRHRAGTAQATTGRVFRHASRGVREAVISPNGRLWLEKSEEPSGAPAEKRTTHLPAGRPADRNGERRNGAQRVAARRTPADGLGGIRDAGAGIRRAAGPWGCVASVVLSESCARRARGRRGDGSWIDAGHALGGLRGHLVPRLVLIRRVAPFGGGRPPAPFSLPRCPVAPGGATRMRELRITHGAAVIRSPPRCVAHCPAQRLKLRAEDSRRTSLLCCCQRCYFSGRRLAQTACWRGGMLSVLTCWACFYCWCACCGRHVKT